MRRGSRRWTIVVFLVIFGPMLLAGLASGPVRAQATFPGVNGKIVFEHSDGAGDLDVYMVNADGSGRRNLTANDDMQDGEPVWSPDGRKIAFNAYRESSSDGTRPIMHGVYVMNADGSDVKQLASFCGYELAWSPDGRKVAFAGCDIVSEIFVVNIDSPDLTRLTSNGRDYSPAWSPDGRKIAFGGPHGIYTMNADGSAQTSLTEAGFDIDPAWSPDGRGIAFVGFSVHTEFPVRDAQPAVYVMNADGSGLRQLPSSGANRFAWSPDGRSVVFESSVPPSSDIYSVNTDGSDLTRLTISQASGGPTWSPDGRKIAFVGPAGIYTMNPDGSDQTRLTNNPRGFDAEASWQTVPSADLALRLTARAGTVKGGRRLTYTITVHNAGPSNAIGVVFSDRLPAQVGLVSVHPSEGHCRRPPPRSTGTITCSLDLQPADTSWSARIDVDTTRTKRTISSTIRVTSSTPDPNPMNNAATATTAHSR